MVVVEGMVVCDGGDDGAGVWAPASTSPGAGAPASAHWLPPAPPSFFETTTQRLNGRVQTRARVQTQLILVVIFLLIATALSIVIATTFAIIVAVVITAVGERLVASWPVVVFIFSGSIFPVCIVLLTLRTMVVMLRSHAFALFFTIEVRGA